MKAVSFETENDESVTVYNFSNFEYSDVSSDGELIVGVTGSTPVEFENIKKIKRVFEMPESTETLISLLLSSVEDGEVHLDVDGLGEDIVKTFTQTGLGFKDNEAQRFHLYVPEEHADKNYKDMPVENITVYS